MPISKNFSSILSRDWEINFLQCYPNGVLQYTALCDLFQLTAATHSELGGISFSDMQEFGQAWVLSRMRVEIARLPKWKEQVSVKTWVQSLENSRSVRCLELYAGDEKLAGCETFWAVFNTNTRRPEALALPHGHFEKFHNWRATEKPVSKIDIPVPMEQAGFHTVSLSDLDIVNHANSVKYLEWCLDSLDAEIVLQQQITAFEMNYLKEVALGDEIAICGSGNVFSVEKDGKVCFAMEMELRE